MENGRGDRYNYDAEGEVYSIWYEALQAHDVANASNPQRAEHFSYDSLGNRQGSNAVAGRGWVDFTRKDNGLNQYTRWTPSGINYNLNGAETSEGGMSMNFNGLNQPIALNSPTTVGSGTYLWFGYDPLGRCVKRWISPTSTTAPNGITFLYYDGWNLIQENPAGASAPHIYVQGAGMDELVADYNYATDAQWHYHHADARGHCILLTGATGAVIEQYDYDAFGQPYFYNAIGQVLTGGSVQGNRFLFTGREWLKELRAYDFRNRLYLPQLGRFIQPDPVGLQIAGQAPIGAMAAFGDVPKVFPSSEFNLYRYCHNDPINQKDPTGC